VVIFLVDIHLDGGKWSLGKWIYEYWPMIELHHLFFVSENKVELLSLDFYLTINMTSNIYVSFLKRNLLDFIIFLNRRKIYQLVKWYTNEHLFISIFLSQRILLFFRILLSSPFIALSYFGVWCLPDISEGGKFAYYLVVHSLLWTFTTVSSLAIIVCNRKSINVGITYSTYSSYCLFNIKSKWTRSINKISYKYIILMIVF